MNADIKVEMNPEDDNERADILLRKLGSLVELQFSDRVLNGITVLDNCDVCRLLEVIKEAEAKRIEPHEETIKALEFLRNRLHYLDDDKSRLELRIKLSTPVSSCGSVRLVPNLEPERGDAQG